MNRYFRIISLLLILILAAQGLFTVCADTNAQFAFVKSKKAALYTNNKMTTLSKYLYQYEIVKIQSTDNVKAKVTSGSKEGYIYLSDITQVTPLGYTAVVNRSAKIYTKPSTSSSKKSVSKNTVVNVLAVSGSWVMIEKNGTAAYIQKGYLSSQIEEETKKQEAAGKDSYTLSGTVHKAEFQAYVNCTKLTVYSKASTSSTKLGTISKNTVVTVYAYNSTWAYVELNGKFGYAKKASLKKTDASETAAASESVNNTEQAAAPETLPDGFASCENVTATAKSAIYVYAVPSSSGKYIGSVSKGCAVKVLGYNGSWAYITLNGKYGYTRQSGLTIVNPTATPTPAPTPTPTPLPTAAPTAKVYISNDEIFTDTETTNEQKAFRFLSSQTAYNEAVACGIMASLKQESNFNPLSGKGSSYQGICQWSKTRFAILTTWCEKQNLDPYSLEGQLKFLAYDLSERYTVYHKALLKIENTADGAYEAGYYFCYNYERPSNAENSAVKRGNNARSTYWTKYVG